MKNALIFLMLFIFFVPNLVFAETNGTLQVWAQNAATEVMTFHFNNFETRKQENKRFFTSEGYKKFYTALEQSQIPKSVVDNKLMVEMQVLCLPEIVQSPTKNEDYWILKFPSKTSWVQGAKAKTNFLRTTMKVSLLANTNSDFGIEQWISVPISEQEAQSCSEEDLKRAQIQILQKEIQRKEEEIKKLQAELSGN